MQRPNKEAERDKIKRLLDDRVARYTQAKQLLGDIMSPECIDNQSANRAFMRRIEVHLDAAGISIGRLLEDYFSQEKAPKTEKGPPNMVAVCLKCKREFKSIPARNGHMRTCKK